MAGLDSGGGTMDFEYDSQPPAFHADSMRNGGRISRCPALANSSWSPLSAGSYYGTSSAQLSWPHSPYILNHLAGYHPQHISSNFPGYLPARAPSLPDHLPEPRGSSFLSRPQEDAMSVPAAHMLSGYAATGPSVVDSSPPTTTASSPSATSVSPNSGAERHVSPSTRLPPPQTRAQPVPVAESVGPDAFAASPPSSAANSHNRPTAFVPAPREDQQSPSIRPSQSTSTARVRLPALGNSRQRLPPSEQRLTMTLGNHARYRDLTDSEAEPTHAVAWQTSDDDSDRDFSPGPHTSAGQAYLRNARRSQILRGQMNNKRVASKKAIQSLQRVDTESLPDTEKTCVICYNDFGVASPEGTVEMPLRLPNCKHVFGNRCILKWLQESNSCPYCRDKLESEMARPDQDTIRRILIESELGHMSPSIRHRVYRSQTSDRVEARAEAQSLLRARQHGLEANRDSISRGERRAAPSEDSSDAQRRQRPRFSTETFNPVTAPASTQTSLPAQRAPVWQQGPSLGNPWSVASPYAGPGPAPGGHLPNYALPSLPMANPGFPNDLHGPNFPPMFSREDFYTAPQQSELAQMGFDVSRQGATHENTLPRPLYPFARHTHSPGDPFHYSTYQQHNQQPNPYSNMSQPVRHDGITQAGVNSNLPNRN